MRLTKHIFLEGPDGSGKSTLFKVLTEGCGMPSTGHDGAAPQSVEEAFSRLETVSNSPPSVRDRVQAVSDLVYAKVLGRKTFLTRSEYLCWLDEVDPVIVYCRPLRHVIEENEIHEKPHKSVEFTKTLSEKRHEIITEYDHVIQEVRRRCSVLVYDYTTDTFALHLLRRLEEDGVCVV